MWYENETDKKERQIQDAKSDLSKINAMIELANNNTLALKIHMCGLSVGICNNSKVIPALKYHKKQIELFLDGKENEWE